MGIYTRLHELGIQLGYDLEIEFFAPVCHGTLLGYLGKSQAKYWDNPMRDSASTVAAHAQGTPPPQKQGLAY